MAKLTDLVRDCRDRQASIIGSRVDELEPAARLEYLRWNVLAALDELHEVLGCVDWKPWSKTKGLIRKDKPEIAEELCDVLLFLGNLAVVFDVSDDELAAAYDRVVQKVSLRARNGYAARSR